MNEEKQPSCESLTDKQEAYVRSNYKRMVVQEMSRNIKVPTTRVYSFIKKEGLAYIKSKPGVRHSNRMFPEGCFNPFERENWLI